MCHRIGLCCTSEWMGDAHGVRCEHLEGELNIENGCSCNIYAERYHGMPVKMLDKNGKFAYTSWCQPKVWGEGCCKDKFEDAR